MIFLALLEGAMSYREAYWRDEVASNSTALILSAESIIKDKKASNSKVRKVESRIHGMSLDFEQKMERFNKACYDEIESITKQFSSKADTIFDEYAAGFGMIIEQYLNAKSTGDIISICQAYNAGLLDELLTIIKQQTDEKVQNIADSIEHLDSSIMPENNNATDTYTEHTTTNAGEPENN